MQRRLPVEKIKYR